MRASASNAAPPPSRRRLVPAALVRSPWLLLLALLLAFLSRTPCVAADTLVGANQCKGFDLTKSKYCGHLGTSVLGSHDFTKSLQALFRTNVTTITILGTPLSLDFSNINSAAEFDLVVMEKVVLSKLDYLTKLWFLCTFREQGIQWLSSWFCNIMFNLRAGALKTPCFVDTLQVPLCAATTDALLESAERNYMRDSTCDRSAPARTLFREHIATLRRSVADTPDFRGAPGACVEGARIEGGGACGWAATPAACDALRADRRAGAPGGASARPGTPWLAVGLGLAGGALLAAAGGAAVWVRRRQRRMATAAPQTQQRPSAGTDPVGGGAGAAVVPPSSSSSAAPYTMYVPGDVESILPDDSASNIGHFQRAHHTAMRAPYATQPSMTRGWPPPMQTGGSCG